MTKIGILKKRLVKAYNKKENWEYSEFKGYPKGTYFGYASFADYRKDMLSNYKKFYGKKLKYWRYK